MNYASLDITAIADEFNQIKQQSIDELSSITSSLVKSNRFKNDIDFRGVVTYNIIFATAMTGRHEACSFHLQELNTFIQDIKDHNVMMDAYIHLGYAYLTFNLVDNSFNALMMVIKTERNLSYKTNHTTVAYNNIASLYENLNEYEKALSYYLLAHQYIDTTEISARNITLQSFIPSNIGKIYALLDQPAMANEYLKIAGQAFDFDNPRFNNAKRNLQEAHMFYYAAIGDIKRMQDSFISARKILLSYNDTLNYLKMLVKYCEFCQNLNRPPLDYIVYIEELFTLIETDRYFEPTIRLYDILANYYQKQGEQEKLLLTYRLYNQQVKLSDTKQRQEAIISSKIRTNIVNSYTESNLINDKNKELKRLNEQLTLDKHRLEDITNQLKIISDINQKLINTQDMKDIFKTIYHELSKHISVDASTLAINYENSRKFIIEHTYGLGKRYQDLCLTYDDTYSFIIQCYHKNKIIKFDNFMDENAPKLTYKVDNKDKMQSLLYIPIHYDNCILGILALNSKTPFAYGEREMTFINLLIPQLGVAIENAKQAKALLTEITSHEYTQIKLTKLNKELHLLSSQDSLTKVDNRRSFDSKFNTLIKYAKDNNQSIHIYMIDIDYFKPYNDTYGHLYGDQALIQIAKQLQTYFINENQMFARFGGEEFIAAEVDITSEQAIKKANDMRLKIETLNIKHTHSSTGHITISIGIYHNKKVNTTVSDMLNLADQALYLAKENGRNNVQIIS